MIAQLVLDLDEVGLFLLSRRIARIVGEGRERFDEGTREGDAGERVGVRLNGAEVVNR